MRPACGRLGWLWLMGGLAFCRAAQAAPCPRLDLPQLRALMAQQGSTEVLFYASWCSACRPHLQALAADAVAVGLQDTPARLQAALAYVGRRGGCWRDGGAAAALGVRGLPAHFVLTPRGLQRRP